MLKSACVYGGGGEDMTGKGLGVQNGALDKRVETIILTYRW